MEMQEMLGQELGFELYEVDLFNDSNGDSYSMVIKSIGFPKYSKLENFLREDMEKMHYKNVVVIGRIDYNEASLFYDMSNFDMWPILKND